MTTRAQKLIQLRDQYQQSYLALKRSHRYPSEREERRALGRAEVLDRFIESSVTLSADWSAARVQILIEHLLARFAEQKKGWLLNSIRERRQHGINELGEWTAEGAILQIDEIAPRLFPLLSAQWNASSVQKHGQYFQVFQSADLFTTLRDTEEGRLRWIGPERSQWYQEVALVKVEVSPPTIIAALEEAYRLTNHTDRSGRVNEGMVWHVQRARSTSVGDIVVSLLSGQSWIVEGVGFRAIEDVSAKTRSESSAQSI